MREPVRLVNVDDPRDRIRGYRVPAEPGDADQAVYVFAASGQVTLNLGGEYVHQPTGKRYRLE